MTRAFPHFEGHYQPRVPGELGYYDLRVPAVMQRQVELAKLHGVSAFCFHFYWFAGERLLEGPIEHFLNNKDLDIEFSLCWANENWTRRWDGGKNELIRAQAHSPEDDIEFIRYLGKYFAEARYMKVDGKPVLTVYRPAILPDMAATVRRWREEIRKMGFPGIYLIAANSFGFSDYKKFGFDALSEFPPHNTSVPQLRDLETTPKRHGGLVFPYSSLVECEMEKPLPEGTVHPGIIPGWDNSARRPHDGTIFYDATPALFRKWLDACFARANENPAGERFVFINAWNEWAEGAYLEPDRRYGYAYLAAVAGAVEGRPSFSEKKFPGLERARALEARLFEEYVQNTLSEQRAPEYTDVATEEVETSDVQLIAYYLPQFHPIPENDEWWGKGFTEWRNVARAFPLFEGHYQPRKPAELGYYDLRVPDVMRRQVELARLYGISAFCFHFYWFGGKRLLETPLENFLADKDLDLSFCLCWANENWSRRWDGSENEVLISQSHSDEDDEAFLRYLDKYFKDERYLKIDGRPVLTVYRPAILKDMAATTARWRRISKELGYPDLYLIATNAFSFNDYEKYGFDALSEFPPHALEVPNVQGEIAMTPLRTGWRVRRYADIVTSEKERLVDEVRTIHPGLMPSWDNSARRPTNGEIIHGSTPELFRQWLQRAFSRAIKNPENERLVFVNAWNEWAEGAYLEPDQRFGYAYLEACASVLLEYSNRENVALRSRENFSWEIIEGNREKKKNTKTILLCSHHTGPRVFGGERSFLDVAAALSNAGFNVVATLQNSINDVYVSQLKDCVTEIYVFPYVQWRTERWNSYEVIESVQSFISVIERVGPDLIYANTTVVRAPLEAARFWNVPSIVHAREIVTRDPDIRAQIGLDAEQIVRQIERSSDFIIANSKTTAESFADCANVAVIPNVIDPAPFDMPNVVTDGLVKFGLISSNQPKKGVEDFVELARLSKTSVPNARFLVIGQQGGGLIQDYLSGRKEYPDNLSFVDYQPSAVDAIGLVNVVVSLSSFQESFGRTVLEGMVAGRPTLAYAWGAPTELVDHEVTGFLVPFKDVEAAAQYVRAFCEDTDKLKRMGDAARVQAREKCRLDVFRDRLADVCNRVIDSHHGGDGLYKDAGTERLARVKDKTIDIVVCVHNALQDVKACLESVARHLGDKHRLIVVDDCSDDPTASYLAEFAKQHPSTLLLRNAERAGYTRTANIGLRTATADLVILLNSDTIVSGRWAEKMADAVFSTHGAGIVSPMSNAASYQSLPDVESAGRQTAINELPPNSRPEDVDRFCEGASYAHFPVVPMVHGFCFGITRETINSLGYFDEIAFRDGYGEENDYCLRAFRAGIWSVIATNTFIYHAKSKSYSAARRASLARKGQAQLYKTHGRQFFNANVKVLKEHPDLERMRIMFRRMWPTGQKAQENVAEPI
ncbi:Trans-aconitate methyltransferase OS=Afipia felis OX=1035 GN=NCTC12722_00268 PE=4 SV=1 [Afipia felis]